MYKKYLQVEVEGSEVITVNIKYIYIYTYIRVNFKPLRIVI